jgi:hypothetical protein
MTFQIWLRALLLDGSAHNRSHVIARLGPTTLRALYEQGASPSIQDILRFCEGKPQRKWSKPSEMKSEPGTMANAA